MAAAGIKWLEKREEGRGRGLEGAEQLRVVEGGAGQVVERWVQPWYSQVSADTEFLSEVHYGVEDSLLALAGRLQQMRPDSLMVSLVRLLHR